ncbi:MULTISPECIES: hypothetical protein [Bacillus]|uniref:hypothetical protein n=1 Tax=Bacillus TaxID=1386 RepID=UPI0028BF1DFA|nr:MULTISPECIES: hypothetical protein [Bacillus]MEB5652285.1 hypothetical protein [Bacillus anthracis]
MDETTAFIRGEEVLLDGSVRRDGGTNFSESVKEAHDASKASIQSRISNLESGGVKGTGEEVKKSGDIKVLNNEENFLGLSEAANKSKGAKSYSDWTIYKKEKIEVNPKFREEMIKKEKELEMNLQKQIDDFVERK